MIKLQDGELRDYLPSTMKNDVDMICLSHAIKKATGRLMKYLQGAMAYHFIDEVPEQTLDLLAMELRSPYYSDALPIDKKRGIVKNTLRWHSKAGTPGAVSEMIGVIFGEGKVVEWPDFSEPPYTPGTFDIETDAQITPEMISDFLTVIDRVKNTRSHLRRMLVHRRMDQDIHGGAGVRQVNWPPAVMDGYGIARRVDQAAYCGAGVRQVSRPPAIADGYDAKRTTGQTIRAGLAFAKFADRRPSRMDYSNGTGGKGMPQPFGNAVMTDAGARLLTRAQAGQARIRFTRIAVGDGAYSDEEKELSSLQGMTGLKSARNSYAVSDVQINSEYSVKLTALIANQDPATGDVLVREGYFINEMGLYAMDADGGDETEALYSIAVTTGENGDFMPPYNGFHAAQILQEYYATVNNSATVTIKSDGAVVTIPQFEDLKKRVEKSEGVLQWILSVLFGYRYNKAEKKIVSFLPHDCADGKLTFPEGAARVDGGKIVLTGAAPQIPGAGAGDGAGAESIQEIAEAAAKIVQGNMEEISAEQARGLFGFADSEK